MNEAGDVFWYIKIGKRDSSLSIYKLKIAIVFTILIVLSYN